MRTETKVFILGAGCSYACGYPLFRNFKTDLKSFSDAIANSQRHRAILRSVEKTLNLLDSQQTGKDQISTIDEVVQMIRRGEFDGLLERNDCNKNSRANQNGLNPIARRMEAIKSAKIATSALFLEKEKDALEKELLTGYFNFIADDILFDSSLNWKERLKQSKVRVLSFNYDRMFEYAFARHFQYSFKPYGLYTSDVLNSGMNLQGDGFAKIEADRFCFIKLHGSVGVSVKKEAEGEYLFFKGDEICNWKSATVEDTLFFPAENGDPLIAFPHETKEVLSCQDKLLPFDRYISHTWKHAELVLSEAFEIFIVGYSIPELDAERVLSFLKQAKSCRRIVIRNHTVNECERIQKLLNAHLKGGIQVVLDPRAF